MGDPVNNSNVLFVDLTQLTAADIANLDVETALLAVQMNRANLLDGQLKAEMTKVQQKNDQIALLTTALTKLQGQFAKFKGDDPPTKKLSEVGFVQSDEIDSNDALKAAGIKPFGEHEGECTPTYDEEAHVVPGSDTWPGGVEGSVTKSELDAAIKQIDGMIQNLNSTQQMDMLKLQSLSNKRNEAYEIMTNFIKKMQDNKNSIISNMR